MWKVYKYATGQEVPANGKYLKTIVQKRIEVGDGVFKDCWLVWHYFLIEEYAKVPAVRLCRHGRRGLKCDCDAPIKITNDHNV